jgi:hypothetical protein
MAGVEPGHKRCRASGFTSTTKGILTMKQRIAKHSEVRYENCDRT